jgi:hypothetical protein
VGVSPAPRRKPSSSVAGSFVAADRSPRRPAALTEPRNRIDDLGDQLDVPPARPSTVAAASATWAQRSSSSASSASRAGMGSRPPRPRAPLGPARAPAVAGACARPPLSPGRPGRRGTGVPPRESQAQATRRGGANPRPVRRTPRGPGAVPPPRCTASSPLARPRSPASACGRQREEPVAQLFGFLAEAHGRNARALDGSAQPLGGPPRLGVRPAFAVPWAGSPLEPDGRPSSVRPVRAGRAGRTPR